MKTNQDVVHEDWSLYKLHNTMDESLCFKNLKVLPAWIV